MNRLRLLQRGTLLALHLLLGLVMTPLALVRRAGGGWRTRHGVVAWWHNRLADILGVRITVTGPRPGAPALLVSNHVSWLDVIVLGGLTRTDFLSKDEVRRWPLLGWLAARAGTLFIRRGDGQAAGVSEQIAARLRGGGLLALFPEGTTTDGREVRPFFSRLFGAVIDAGCPLVPVTLRYHVDGAHDALAPYTGDQSLLHNLRGLLGRPHTAVHLVFGQPVALHGRSRRQLAEHARGVIQQELGRPSPVPMRCRRPGWAPGGAQAQPAVHSQ